MYEYPNAQNEDYALKSRSLIIPFSITHSATPANKVRSSDLSSALTLACEGQTSDAAAIDSGTNFATPTDSTGVFGCLISNAGSVKKLLDVRVVNINSGTVAITREGASNSGVTASGNIAVSLDSSLDLTAADLSAHLVVDFLLAK